MTKIKVTIENYGPDIAIWPSFSGQIFKPLYRVQAQFVSWLILHSARANVLTGWRTEYFDKLGYQMMPYIVASRYEPTLPKTWAKKLENAGIRRFDARLPVSTLSLLLGGISWEQAQAARDNAMKLPVTYTGEFYIVGEGVDARHYLYRSQMDYVLAPPSILDPWDAILERGWAWFHFD